MDRRSFLVTSLAGVIAAPLVAEAQREEKAWQVGVLGNSPSPHLDAAFRQGLRERGWIEGRNITLLYRYSEGRNERLAALAAELVALNVDLIVAWAAPEAGAARQATRTIPIVFLVHGDSIASGDVSSLARPGGNITGSAQMLTELSSKQLDLLKQAFPGITRNHGYLVYDTLFGTDENLRIKPQMVDRTTVSADGMKYTFLLRDGLRWHDGPRSTRKTAWSR